MNPGAVVNWNEAVDGRPIAGHGLRAAFRSWAKEIAGFPRAAIEEAMGVRSSAKRSVLFGAAKFLRNAEK